MTWLSDLWRRLTKQPRFRVGERIKANGESGCIKDFVPGRYWPLEGWAPAMYVVEWPGRANQSSGLLWAHWVSQEYADHNYRRMN